MPGKNIRKDPGSGRRDDVSRNERAKKQRRTNNSNRNTGEVNRGNTINTGYNQRTDELHTKHSVTGSDSDGQAE